MDQRDISTALITGGNGFIGSHLANALSGMNKDAKVHLLDNNFSHINPIIEIRDNLFFHESDIANFSKLQRIVEQISPDHVYHLASYVNAERNIEIAKKCVEVNVNGTINIIRSLMHTEIKCFVHLGTSEIYGRNDVPFVEEMNPQPMSPYSASKLSSEIFCKTLSEIYNVPVVLLRAFNVYGDGQMPKMLIPEIILSCLNNKDINATYGEQTREVNYVKDIVNGIILASVTKSAIGNVINLGCGVEKTVKEIIQYIVDEMEINVQIKFGAIPYRSNEIMRMFCDASRAKELLGWEPNYTFEEGIRKTIDWYTLHRLS